MSKKYSPPFHKKLVRRRTIQNLEKIEYRQGMLDKGTKTEDLPVKVWHGAKIPVKEVLAKAKAAAEWCAHATTHEKQHGGKPWTYLLIPHDVIADNKTLQGLVATYTYGGASSGKR